MLLVHDCIPNGTFGSDDLSVSRWVVYVTSLKLLLHKVTCEDVTACAHPGSGLDA